MLLLQMRVTEESSSETLWSDLPIPRSCRTRRDVVDLLSSPEFEGRVYRLLTVDNRSAVNIEIEVDRRAVARVSPVRRRDA